MHLFLHFILIPWLCALTTAIAAAPIGVLIGWRRLIYFGEALSHASLLGIALALYLQFPITLGIWIITLLLILLLYIIQKSGKEDPGNILGNLSHIALALGVLLISTMETVRTDLMSYLFGDILATTAKNLGAVIVVTVICLGVLKKLWQPLIMATVSPALAKTEYPHADKYDLMFLLLIGLFIGTTVQYFGLLLVIALLIIPANTANRLSKTPEQATVIAAVAGACATVAGTAVAWFLDVPVSPAIICFAGVEYFLVLIATLIRKKCYK